MARSPSGDVTARRAWAAAPRDRRLFCLRRGGRGFAAGRCGGLGGQRRGWGGRRWAPGRSRRAGARPARCEGTVGLSESLEGTGLVTKTGSLDGG